MVRIEVRYKQEVDIGITAVSLMAPSHKIIHSLLKCISFRPRSTVINPTKEGLINAKGAVVKTPVPNRFLANDRKRRIWQELSLVARLVD
jgi:hypothetical protein